PAAAHRARRSGAGRGEDEIGSESPGEVRHTIPGRSTVQISIRSTVARLGVLAALGGAAYAAVPAVAASSVDKAAAALVPANIRSKGTVTVASDASYAPNEFIAPDGKTVIGMDADLAKAIFRVLALKVKVVNGTFGAI